MEKSLQNQLKEVKGTDLLVGIPSYNNAGSIGHVVKTVTSGLAKYFPGAKAVLVNSDGGSTDGTQDEVKRVQTGALKTILTSHPVHPVHKITAPYHGLPGKGSALRAIFEAADALGVRACAVVNSNLRSITPEWMQLLLKPVCEEGFDCVVPLYARHKFDGTITNSIVYPLTRALYGKRAQQPIGGDFGFSPRLARSCLTKSVWDTDVARFGIDIWMITLALAEEYKVCQSCLGTRTLDTRNTESDLGSMFTQVVSSVYGLMEEYEHLWKKVKGSQPVPTFGSHCDVGIEPVSVNVDRMIGSFRLGARNLAEIWRKALCPETALGLESIARISNQAYSFPEDLWVRTIYGFAVAYHKGSIHREHLLKSMIPLYLGRVAAFVKENWESSALEVEERTESLCRVFEEMKPYLIERWG